MKKFILITTVVLSAGALSSATNTTKENKEKFVIAPVNSLTTGFKRDLGSAD
jgi:hypothetical protein